MIYCSYLDTIITYACNVAINKTAALAGCTWCMYTSNNHSYLDKCPLGYFSYVIFLLPNQVVPLAVELPQLPLPGTFLPFRVHDTKMLSFELIVTDIQTQISDAVRAEKSREETVEVFISFHPEFVPVQIEDTHHEVSAVEEEV